MLSGLQSGWSKAAVALAVPIGLVLGAFSDDDPEPVVSVTSTSSGNTTETTVSGPLTGEQLAAQFGAAVWEVEADGCDQFWTGTAFAIDPNHLVTNRHVVANDVTPTLVSRTGAEINGRVIGWSERPDLAIIETTEFLPKWLDWAPTDDLAEGMPLVALGYPAPEGDFTVTPGTVLSFQLRGNQREAIRSDALIDRGNSGGPALDENGKVMGVVTEIAANDGGLQMFPLIYTYDSVGPEVDSILESPEEPEADCGATGASDFIPQSWDENPSTWSSGAVTYGDHPVLDGLWDRCYAGEMAACDELWWMSPEDTDYESFGYTCGNRSKGGDWCDPNLV